MKKIPFKTVTGSAGCIALAKHNDYLYAAGGDNLSVYDISKPDKPQLVWKRGGFGHGRQLVVLDGHLYLTAREYGLWIIDISNPLKPKKVTRFDTVELATGIAVTKDTVFVAQRVYGIEIIDVSDPHNPQHLSLVRTPEAQSCAYDEGMLYVGDWGAGRVTVIDVDDRSNPVIINTAELEANGDGVAVAGGLCYAATGLDAKSSKNKSEHNGDGHGLEIFQLHDRAKKPKRLARIEFPCLDVKTNDFWTVKLAGKNAIVADTHNGVFNVNVSDPTNPTISGHIELPHIVRMDSKEKKRERIHVPDCAGDVAVGSGVIYVAGQKTGLHVAKISGIAPEDKIESTAVLKTGIQKREEAKGMQRIECGGQVRRLALDGDILYAACSHAGIKVMRLDGDGTRPLDVIPVKCSYDVAVSDGKLYSAEGTDGVAVYSLYPECKELGRFKGRKRIFQLLRPSSNGRFVACGCRDGLLRILDVSDPSAIRQVFKHLHGGLMYGDTFPDKDINDLLPVIWPYRGLAWYDLSGAEPKYLLTIKEALPVGQTEGISLMNDRYLINCLNGECHLLNPQTLEPDSQKIVSPAGGFSGVPTASNKSVAFSHRGNGEVDFWQLSDSYKAKQVKKRSLSGLYGTPDRIVFHKDRMLIPCGHQGLLIEKL